MRLSLQSHPFSLCQWFPSLIFCHCLFLPSSPLFSVFHLNVSLLFLPKVPLLKEQKQCVCGVQHVHRETPVHREGPSFRPASIKLYLVSAAGSGWVRTAGPLCLISVEALVTLARWCTCCRSHAPCHACEMLVNAALDIGTCCQLNLRPPYLINVWNSLRCYETRKRFMRITEGHQCLHWISIRCHLLHFWCLQLWLDWPFSMYFCVCLKMMCFVCFRSFRGKLTVFTVLCEQYQPSLKRDPMYNEVSGSIASSSCDHFRAVSFAPLISMQPHEVVRY